MAGLHRRTSRCWVEPPPPSPLSALNQNANKIMKKRKKTNLLWARAILFSLGWIFTTAFLFLRGIPFATEHDNLHLVPSHLIHKKPPDNNSSLVSPYCQTNGSLHQISLQMAHFSSRPGSPSYQKTLQILKAASCYHVYDPQEHSIFRNVAQHLQLLLEGFGLQAWASPQCQPRTQHFLLLEISFYALNADKTNYICNNGSFNCSGLPRIILQSEQLEQVGDAYLDYLKTCHESPLCVIWDFSDHHYRWAQQKNISESVMLLPIMHQSLLGDYNDKLIPWADRSLDVVFFGSMTTRRQEFLNTTHWNHTLFNYTFQWQQIKQTYANAKICLMLHSYSATSAGEYHRLNELGASGCLPVVETWDDKIGAQAYRECGGVRMATLNELAGVVTQSLVDNNNASIDMARRVTWWNQKIAWKLLLGEIFGPHNAHHRVSSSTSSKKSSWFG